MAGEEPAAPDAVSGWIADLGHDDHDVRREAFDQLLVHSSDAHAAVLAVLDHPDAEVRRSARRLLEVFLHVSYREQLQAFVDDTDGDADDELPGWKRFRELAGDDYAARTLFADMHRAEPGLFASYAAEAPLSDALRVRLAQVLRTKTRESNPRPLPSPSVLALMFVGSDPLVQLEPEVADHDIWSMLLNEPDFRRGMSEEDRGGEMLRSIVNEWIASPTGPRLAKRKLMLATQFGLPAGIGLAVPILEDRTAAVDTRLMAIHAAGRVGGEDYASLLVPLLEDETVCSQRMIVRGTRRDVIGIEIRDVALAWLIHVTGQDFHEYGMPDALRAFERLERNPFFMVSLAYLGFESEEQRDRALSTWREWAQANQLPDPPTVEVAEPLGPAAAGGAGRSPIGAVSAIPATDGDLVRLLFTAQRHAEAGNAVDAALVLGQLLALPADFTYQPVPGAAHHRGLKSSAEELLLGLPHEGREAYVRRYAAIAEQELDAALAQQDFPAVVKVAQSYLLTPAGAEALFLLGMHHLDRGDALWAAHCLDRLRRLEDSARFEPVLSLTLARAWSLAHHPERAAEVERTFQAPPAGRLNVGGVEEESGRWPWPDTSGGRTVANDWRLFHGDADGNRLVPEGGPFLVGDPVVPVDYLSPLQDVAAAIREEARTSHEPRWLTARPLVVGDLVLVRTPAHLVCLDTEGVLRWSAESEDPLLRLSSMSGPPPQRPLSGPLADRVWRDARWGTLSADDQRVYCVEDLRFSEDAAWQRLAVMDDGSRRLVTGGFKPFNRLVAYDLETGKVQWELGGSTGSGLALDGYHFAGPPLPLGRRLFAVARAGHWTHLIEIDAGSGDVLSNAVLAQQDRDPTGSQKVTSLLDVPIASDAWIPPHPVLYEGVLVTAISPTHLVAMDLVTRSIRWSFSLSDHAHATAHGKPGLAALMPTMPDRAEPRWIGTTLRAADGLVLVAPATSDALTAIDVSAGTVRWEISRDRGLHVAGVAGDLLVIVGRDHVRAHHLVDGTAAWRTDLPHGSYPTGHGLLSEQTVLVPLSTADVAQYDLATGRLVARSRSLDGIVPGNLVRAGSRIYSQSVAGTWEFPILKTVEAGLAAGGSLDTTARIRLGRVLLYQGRAAEALQELQHVLESNPSPADRQLVLDAVLEALRHEGDRFVPLIDELDLRPEEAHDPAAFYRRLAEIHRDADRPLAALTALERQSRFVLRNGSADVAYVSAGFAVRPDVEVRGELMDLCAASPRASERLGELIDGALAESDFVWVSTFADFHPAATAGLLPLAESDRAHEQWLSAEQRLLSVWREGSAEQQRTAAIRLALTYREAGMPRAAASWYDRIVSAGPQMPFDGRTGSEWLAELPPDDPVRHVPSFEWPAGEFQVARRPRDDEDPVPMLRPVTLAPADEYGRPLPQVLLDRRGQELLIRHPAGPPLFKVDLTELGGMSAQIGFSGPHVHQSGHSLLLAAGNRVAALDLTGDAADPVRWVQGFEVARRGDAAMAIRMRAFALQQIRPGMGFQNSIATPRMVAWTLGTEVRCVDRHTGDLRWKREDIPEGSELLGDDEYLVLLPPGESQGTVLHASSGRDAGSCTVPRLDRRIAYVGRRILIWTSHEEACRLELFDPARDRPVWRMEFAGNAAVAMLEPNDALVLEPDGRLTAVELAEGESGLLARIEPPATPFQLDVFPTSQRLVVAVNNAHPDAANQVGVDRARMPVDGRLVSIARSNGEVVWSREVRELSIDRSQPSGLPVLVLTRDVRNPGGRTSYHRILALDARTGEVLFEERNDGVIGIHSITGDPMAGRVELMLRTESIFFELGN